MSFSEDQIQQLYRFTRKHFVEHYDLQTELVDHLANGIEDQIKELPNITFDQALQLEFKKFGVFGFADVIKERTNAMGKRYHKIIWGFFKEWFKIPKLVFTLGLMILCALILGNIKNIEDKSTATMMSALFLAVLVLVFLFKSRKDRDFKMVRQGKKWMLGDMIYNFGSGGSISVFFAQIAVFTINMNKSIVEGFWFDIMFSAVFVGVMILCYVMMFIIPSKADALLSATYPEYKMI